MHEIFISYRRGDTVARELKQKLDKRFYRDVAFLDEQSPTTGPLAALIREKIRDAQYVVFLISRDWLAHAANLSSPNNFVRLEIEQTLEQKKTFVPVFIGPDAKTEFQSRFFDASGKLVPTAPAFVPTINEQLFVEIYPGDPRKYRVGLHDLFVKLEPGLVCYWHRLARWRWGGYGLAVLVALTCLLAMTCVIAFLIGYAVESPGPLIVHRYRHPTGKIDLKLRDPSPNVGDDETPLKDKLRNWLDQWIRRVGEGVEREDQQILDRDKKLKKPHRYMALLKAVSTTRFGRNYQTITAALNTKAGYRIKAAFAFLARNATFEDSYAPVYRQMVVAIAEDENGLARNTVTFTNPNEHEEILILAIIENQSPDATITPSISLLTLEAQ